MPTPAEIAAAIKKNKQNGNLNPLINTSPTMTREGDTELIDVPRVGEGLMTTQRGAEQVPEAASEARTVVDYSTTRKQMAKKDAGGYKTLRESSQEIDDQRAASDAENASLQKQYEAEVNEATKNKSFSELIDITEALKAKYAKLGLKF